MAEQRICDVCKNKLASRSFKVKLSLKGQYERTGYGGRWNSLIWSPYERIDICGECAEKLLGLSYRDSNGHGNPTASEIIEKIQKQTVNTN